MGNLCKSAPPKVYNPTPDPTTGLTEKERELIEESWRVIGSRKTILKNAVDFFMMLFQVYPTIKNHFDAFKHKTLEELSTSPRMRAHAASVFYFIESYVENLEDADTLVGLVEKMAVSHIQRGLPVSDLEKLRRVFLEFLRSNLGDKCTPELEVAWDKLFRAQNAVFMMTEEELQSDDDDSNDGSD